MAVRVRLEKRSENKPNHNGVDKGYWVTGELLTSPAIGESLLVSRDCRNGVKVPGLFYTSCVQEIIDQGPEGVDLVTENSTWRLTQIGS